MKLKFVLIMLTISMINKDAFAQNISKALKIGDTVPDFEFEIMNDSMKRISLSSLKGKLVILDFWASFCSTCIMKFPKLDSLQAKYKGKIKIILVDPKAYRDTKEKINGIFRNYEKKYGKTLGLSSSINDTVALNYFPHKKISHFVWIDKDGVFKATSGDVSQKGIESMLEENRPNFMQKDDFHENDQSEKLFTKNPFNVKFKSMITGYLDSLTQDFEHKYMASLQWNKGNGIVRYINESLIRVLGEIHSYRIDNTSRILFEGLNRADFIYDNTSNGEEWMKKNSFCYELIAPVMTKAEIKAQVKRDLEGIFGLQSSIETRKVPCWVIKMDENQMKKIQKKKNPGKDFGSLVDIAGSFQRLELPVLVETKFNNKIFPLTDELSGINTFGDLDFSDLQRFVKENGLTIVKEERALEMFVIKKMNK